MSNSIVSKGALSSQGDKPKSFWDSILTSTPVVLTIVATLLAGLSSSEMTRAQYHRSLAAQHQSKAGDQWGFFQAKRIRGGNTEMEIELLRAQHFIFPVTPDAVAEYAARLPQNLDRTARVAEQLLNALSGTKADTGSDSPRPVVEKLAQTARQKANDARALEKRMAETLALPEMREAFGYLNTDKLPTVTRQAVGGATSHEAHEAIQARRTEAETASLMIRIPDDELQQALDAAESNAAAFDNTTKPIDKQLTAAAQLIQEATTLTGAVHQLAERAALALTEIASMNETAEIRTAAASDARNQLRSAAAALARTDAALTKSTEEMNQSFLAARRDFTARRYEREARDNQEIAGVYEIQVRKSSWESERHRKRSQLFFLGMLIAQAGVTIATFSLALRQRNILWALATAAGLAAISFSAYVYLYT